MPEIRNFERLLEVANDTHNATHWVAAPDSTDHPYWRVEANDEVVAAELSKSYATFLTTFSPPVVRELLSLLDTYQILEAARPSREGRIRNLVRRTRENSIKLSHVLRKAVFLDEEVATITLENQMLRIMLEKRGVSTDEVEEVLTLFWESYHHDGDLTAPETVAAPAKLKLVTK